MNVVVEILLETKKTSLKHTLPRKRYCFSSAFRERDSRQSETRTNALVISIELTSLLEVKMCRGSPICERVCKKIVEYFENNVPQRKIAKALQISLSTVHNIIKRFRETGEIAVRKGQG